MAEEEEVRPCYERRRRSLVLQCILLHLPDTPPCKMRSARQEVYRQCYECSCPCLGRRRESEVHAGKRGVAHVFLQPSAGSPPSQPLSPQVQCSGRCSICVHKNERQEWQKDSRE